MILNTIAVHYQGVVVEGGICPVRTCLVVAVISLENLLGLVGDLYCQNACY